MESLISKNYLSLEAARKSGTERKPGGFPSASPAFSHRAILKKVVFSITTNVQIDSKDPSLERQLETNF